MKKVILFLFVLIILLLISGCAEEVKSADIRENDKELIVVDLKNTSIKKEESNILDILDSKTWIKIDPIQCLGNPWEVEWLKSQNKDHPGYPRDDEFEIIKDYYEKQDITILDIKSIDTYEAVCGGCTCPTGDTLYLLIFDSDVNKMLELGYEIEEEVFIIETIQDIDETKIIEFNGKKYELIWGQLNEVNTWGHILYSISLTINQESFEDLVTGEIVQLKDGTFFGIVKLMGCERGEVPCPEVMTFYLGVDKLNFTPSKFDERLCSADDECVRILKKCCTCHNSAPALAINEKYLGDYGESINCGHCEIGVSYRPSSHWSCTAEPKCINNKCELVK